MELRDKVVVVTGGASGIGMGLCRRFREEQVRGLVIADLNGEAASALAGELDAKSVQLDVRDEAAIAAMVAEIESEFGQIDLFCSNAGVLDLDGGDYWASSSANEVWQRNWEIHVMAHIYAAGACLPSMIERGEGYFLHTVSAAGLLSQPYTAAYATTKHAAIRLRRILGHYPRGRRHQGELLVSAGGGYRDARRYRRWCCRDSMAF